MYTEAVTILLTVDVSYSTSVVVHVASRTEPAGESVTMSRGGPGETWHGSIATAFGTATPDNVLQVRERDIVTATYQDVSPPHTATAEAHILARGPPIHDVHVKCIGSSYATLLWT